MPNTMPEVLDYRDLVGKLARIDSEWESLKGLLTFKRPFKDEEPAKDTAAQDNFQIDLDNNVVVFPTPSSHVKTRAGGEADPAATAVTSREREALTPNNGENTQDGTLMGRLIKVERQIHKLTVLVIASMALAIALGAVLIFLGFKDNLVNRAAFRQPQEITSAANLSSSEAAVPASNGQPASATAMPEANVSKSVEPESPPAAAEPAPKLVGSLTSNKVHDPDCKWAAKINPKKLVTFPSLEAAREQGYIPCPVCRPHESDETH